MKITEASDEAIETTGAIDAANANNVRLEFQKMNSNELGEYIAAESEAVLHKIEELRPLYVELWKRFDDLADGEKICNCRTRSEYCRTVLNRSIRSVQYALYGRQKVMKISDAAELAEVSHALQNSFAGEKFRAGRRVGEILNEIEKSQGYDAIKRINRDADIPSVCIRQYRKDAEIPLDEFENCIKEVCSHVQKELTISKIRGIGKVRKIRQMSAAEKLVNELSKWADSVLIKSVCRREYAGSQDDLIRAEKLLRRLSDEFLSAANLLRFPPKSLEAIWPSNNKIKKKSDSNSSTPLKEKYEKN